MLSALQSEDLEHNQQIPASDDALLDDQQQAPKQSARRHMNLPLNLAREVLPQQTDQKAQQVCSPVVPLLIRLLGIVLNVRRLILSLSLGINDQ
jgi:hypothetical protein